MIHNLSGYVAGYTAEIQQRIAGYQAREDAKRREAEYVRAGVDEQTASCLAALPLTYADRYMAGRGNVNESIMSLDPDFINRLAAYNAT